MDINGTLKDVDGRIFDIISIKRTRATSMEVQSIIFSAASLGKQNNVILKSEIISIGAIKFIV